MDVALDNLPDDVETLRAMILAERAQQVGTGALQAQVLAQNEANKVEIAALEAQVRNIRLSVWPGGGSGARSPRSTPFRRTSDG